MVVKVLHIITQLVWIKHLRISNQYDFLHGWFKRLELQKLWLRLSKYFVGPHIIGWCVWNGVYVAKFLLFCLFYSFGEMNVFILGLGLWHKRACVGCVLFWRKMFVCDMDFWFFFFGEVCLWFWVVVCFYLQMDRYQRVEKPRAEMPINENEIRITTQGRMRNYITYATTLLQVSVSFSRLINRYIDKRFAWMGWFVFLESFCIVCCFWWFVST